MSGEFGVVPDELMRIIERMTEVEQRAEASIAAMDSEVRNLHATFTGEAATAHAQAHEKWARGAEQMRHALKGLRDASHAAHGNYTGAAAKNLQNWA
ncbi:WXG100 family type VII secretion target [Mycobacteroides abscessus subsp. massiliense]|uniref:ESAT-6-like protein n=1 Tax=Mycobacteroides immunogenum TaxID=83262 RepID=A0A7V8RXK2_9MYCO|nr:WXG100 family type VII secretion target [Mycobacteroides immunogenum]AMT71997.1 secretion protein [Mycobacteroides immunogenum]ANO05129.1 secretion protein [Mycobacteroides immunogenum]KIU40199.1 secretion protein [Mycobacteroides immunogenum]KPG13773.1 secretion protein [Mycobacteroides immunogenum]KPG14234.1 secretion protein [Mycobacteroides immunogenum]